MAEQLPVGLNYGLDTPKLVESAAVSRYGQRAIAIFENGDPFWQVDMRVQHMDAVSRQRTDAFISRCRNGQVTVHYTPQHIMLPRAYWGNPGAAALGDTGVLSAIAGNQLSIGGVTDGLQLLEGDLIGLSFERFNTMVRVTSDAIAANGSIVVKADPFLPSYIPVGAAVLFKAIKVNMRLLPGSYICPDEFLPTATFTLIEVPE